MPWRMESRGHAIPSQTDLCEDAALFLIGVMEQSYSAHGSPERP